MKTPSIPDLSQEEIRKMSHLDQQFYFFLKKCKHKPSSTPAPAGGSGNA